MIPTRYENISEPTILNLNKSTYEEQTPLQRNPAYAGTNLTTIETSKPENAQALADTEELAYEIVPLISCQPASATTILPSSREEDGYNELTGQEKGHSQ